MKEEKDSEERANEGVSRGNFLKIAAAGVGAAALSLTTDKKALAAQANGLIQYWNNGAPDGASSFYWNNISNTVGIGTTSPLAKLDIQNFSDVSSRLLLRIRDLNAAGNGGTELWIQGNANREIVIANIWTKLHLGASGSGTVAQSLTIDTTGNVGIGTATPAQKLDVNGTVKSTGFIMPTGAAAGRVLTCDPSGNGSWQEPASLWTRIYSGTPDVYYISPSNYTTDLLRVGNVQDYGGLASIQAINHHGFQALWGYSKSSELYQPQNNGMATSGLYCVAENDYPGGYNVAAYGAYIEGRAGNNMFTAGIEVDIQTTTATAARNVDPVYAHGTSNGPVGYGIMVALGGTKSPYGQYDSSVAIGIVAGAGASVTGQFLKGIMILGTAIKLVNGHMEAIALGYNHEIAWYGSATAVSRLYSDSNHLYFVNSIGQSFTLA